MFCGSHYSFHNLLDVFLIKTIFMNSLTFDMRQGDFISFAEYQSKGRVNWHERDCVKLALEN